MNCYLKRPYIEMPTLLKKSFHEMLSFTQLCANEDLPPMPKNWQAWRGWKAPGEKGGGWRAVMTDAIGCHTYHPGA